MKTIIFYLIQFTWALPVNLVGLIMYAIAILSGCKHERFYNAFVVDIPSKQLLYALSLGVFIFRLVKAGEPMGKNWSRDILVHEYGHTYQAMILGPLYWFVVGIPSFIWLNLFAKYRIRNNISYYDFYTEEWANRLGDIVTNG